MQNVFEQPLLARFVELAPETWSEDGIGATLELLGCYHPYREQTVTPAPDTALTPPVAPPTADGVTGDKTELFLSRPNYFDRPPHVLLFCLCWITTPSAHSHHYRDVGWVV